MLRALLSAIVLAGFATAASAQQPVARGDAAIDAEWAALSANPVGSRPVVPNEQPATGIFSGLGPRNAPVFAADRLEVAYDLATPWNGERFGLQTRAVRLVRPRVQASLDAQGRLRFGALQPLIDEALKAPRRPNVPGPAILVEDARLDLATPGGAPLDYMPDYAPLAWIRSLKALEAMDFTVVIPGHGVPVAPKSALAERRAYLEALMAAVKAEIDAGTPGGAIPDKVKLPQFAHLRGYERNIRDNVRRIQTFYGIGW